MKEILENINQAALKFLMSLTPEETYEAIVKEATKLVGGDDCGIYFRNNKTGEFYVVNKGYKSEVKKPRKRGSTYKAYKTGRSFIVYKEETYKTHPRIKSLKKQSRIFVPLSYQNKSIGVLVIRSKNNITFSQNELGILSLFGSIASLAIRKMQLYSQTKDALNMRDLFISMAAHELRTPLTSINGFVQLLYRKHINDNNNDSKWTKYLLWESTRLTNLVDELLSINKIKSRKLDFRFKEYSLKQALYRSLINFKFLHPKRKVIINDYLKKENEMIIGDMDKLIQVFDNILDNAAKFSPDNKTIRLTLKSQNNNIIIKIKDQGKGIPKKELPCVFHEFFRGKNAQHEGMGLGLYLSKYIVEQHRGRINIKSELNRGAELIVKFPIAKI